MNSRQQAFLEAMLAESTIQQAAKVAGISRNTAHRYLNDPSFQGELSKRRNESIGEAVQYLKRNLSKCSEELVKIIEDPDTAAQVRINAVNAVFSAYRNLGEAAEIQARLEQIEAMLLEVEESVNR